MKLLVPEEAAGQRLDRYLASLAEVGSRSAAERLLESESVLVDGHPHGKSHRLTGGEQLEFEPPQAKGRALAPERMDLRIAYEDEYLVVVDKPAGLVVHPAPGHASGTLVHGLLEHEVAGGDADRPGIVHRLDRDTSGLMVVARSDEAHRRLQALVRKRALERHYLALVVGLPRSRSGRIEAPIGRDRRDPLRHSLDSDSPREAITHFEVVELLSRHALLDVRLETGRTHQIRVHLSHLGFPIVGDDKYGDFELNKRIARASPPDGLPRLARMFLHAGAVDFQHPVTSRRMTLEAPLPSECADFLKGLEPVSP